MFERLQALFHNPSSYETPLPDADARHLMGTLLVRAAKSDNAYLFEEVQLIDKVLAERNGLNPVEAAKMRAACEKLEASMPGTGDLARRLRDTVSTAEKEATLRALWRVVFADGIKREVEDRMLHQIEEVLGITPDRAKALHDSVSP